MPDAKPGLNRFLQEEQDLREDQERTLRRGLSLVLAAATAWNYRGVLLTVGGKASSGQTLGEALYDPLVSSPAFGLLVFAALTVFRRERVLSAIGSSPAWGLAVLMLGLGAGLRVWAHEIGAPDLLMLSFVCQMAGLSAVLGGRALLSALSMPLLALIVVIPLPTLLVHRLIFPMQLGTAALTSFLLDLLGRSHFLAGDQILTEGIIFQVIEGCSGMKSTLSLLLAAVAYSDLVGKTRLEKGVIVLLAFPLGFLTNGFRVLALVLGEVPADSIEHEAYGLGMVAVGVIMLSMVELVLSKTIFSGRRGTDSARRPVQAGRPGVRAQARPLLSRLAGVCVLTLAVLALLWSVPPGTWTSLSVTKFNIELLPRTIEGRKAKGFRYDDRFLGSLAFRHRLFRSYEIDGEAPIRVFVGLEDDFHRNRNGLSSKTRIPRSGWLSIEAMEPPDLAAIGGEQLRIRYPREEILLEHYRIGYAPWAIELISSWFGLDRLIGARPEPALVIRVETDITEGDREAAELRLRHFSDRVWHWYKTSG